MEADLGVIRSTHVIRNSDVDVQRQLRTFLSWCVQETGAALLVKEKNGQEDSARSKLPAALEELDGPLMLLGGRAGREGAEIPALPRLWILLSGIETVFPRREFANHDREGFE